MLYLRVYDTIEIKIKIIFWELIDWDNEKYIEIINENSKTRLVFFFRKYHTNISNIARKRT